MKLKETQRVTTARQRTLTKRRYWTIREWDCWPAPSPWWGEEQLHFSFSVWLGARVCAPRVLLYKALCILCILCLLILPTDFDIVSWPHLQPMLSLLSFSFQWIISVYIYVWVPSYSQSSLSAERRAQQGEWSTLNHYCYSTDYIGLTPHWSHPPLVSPSTLTRSTNNSLPIYLSIFPRGPPTSAASDLRKPFTKAVSHCLKFKELYWETIMTNRITKALYK